MKKDLISTFNTIHDNFYDYSKMVYVNAHTKIIIICPIHGEFSQEPQHHKNGRGCQKCGEDKRIESRRMTLTEFITSANCKHNHKYKYNSVQYVNARTHVIIECPIHGNFKQPPFKHLKGQGCPHCHIDYTDPNYTHYVYEIVNTLNNKTYIGVHSTKDINDNYMGSGHALKLDQQTYGIEYFNKRIIKYCTTRDDASKLEASIVTETYTRNPNTYNIMVGGVWANMD